MSASSPRYDAPLGSPIAKCIECNGMGERGGNTAFACRCTARRVKHLEAEVARLTTELENAIAMFKKAQPA